MAIIQDNVYFDGTDLASISGLTVLAKDPTGNKRTLSLIQLARANKGKLTGAFYTDRVVAVRVCIQRNTKAQAETSYDDLMAIVQGNEKQLIINQSGGQRCYISTYQDTVFAARGGAYMEFTLMFACSDKFGYDVVATQLLAVTGITTGSRTDALTIAGSAPLQQPYFKITLTSVTPGVGTKYVVVGNSANGQAVTIRRTNWTAGDVIEIGPSTPGGDISVKVNGSEVAFTGAIPSLPKGTVSWIYTDNFTSRTFNILINNFKRFV